MSEMEIHRPEDETNQPKGEETFHISGEELLAKVKELLNEGNVRRIILSREGKTLMEMPVNVGAAGLAVAAVISPVLVAVGAIAAVVSQVELTVIRD
jgi:hypothetical protein